ncbi:MAG: hypothetical protein V1717_02965 [Candidatus Micrarchaeota archaeon]
MPNSRTGKSKGFISAPLIGTVVFLAAVVFIVNLQNVEAQASLRIANDAYHNRVSSVLEQHRSDLSSIFREGLSRTIAFYLLEKGWDAFRWQNEGNTDVPLSQVKLSACTNIRDIGGDVMCSIQNTESLEYSYGLPQWMSKFLDNFVFEGITFNTSNVAQIKMFLPNQRINEGVDVTTAINDYNSYCRALVRGSIFDCDAFATSDILQCKDGSTIIPGCEDGTFFVKINVENPDPDTGVEVYGKLPRVEANDGAGNLVRSSGIGERNFYLPINLRLYKYYQETFKAYETLAYGAGGEGGSKDEGESEGIADGHCGGPDCPSAESYADSGYSADGSDLNSVKAEVKQVFFDSVFTPACERVTDPATLTGFGLRFCADFESCESGNPESGSDCTDSSIVSDAPALDPSRELCADSDGDGHPDLWCAYYDDLGLNFMLVDDNPAYRIDPVKPVTFKWGVGISHKTS